jgi:hypothetical protein
MNTTTNWTKTEVRRRLRDASIECRRIGRMPKNWRVEVGGRTVTVVKQTLPEAHEIYPEGDDLTSFDTPQRFAEYVEQGEIVHLYFSSTGEYGETEHVCCVWIGTTEHEPVVLDFDGKYRAQPAA